MIRKYPRQVPGLTIKQLDGYLITARRQEVGYVYSYWWKGYIDTYTRQDGETTLNSRFTEERRWGCHNGWNHQRLI